MLVYQRVYTDTPKSGGLIITCRWVSHRGIGGWDSLGYITHFANPFETHENLFTMDYIYIHIDIYIYTYYIYIYYIYIYILYILYIYTLEHTKIY